MKRFCLAMQFLVFGFAATAFAAPFQNGGFEVGAPVVPCFQFSLGIASPIGPGWTVSAGDVDWVCNANNWVASEGTHSLDLVGSSNIGGVSQAFDVTSGTSYQVLFDLAGNFGNPPVVKPLTVTLTDGGGPVIRNYSFDTAGATSANMGWATKTFTFVANGSSATIDFVSNPGGGTNAGAALDNVRVQQLNPWVGGGSATNQGTPIGSSPTVISDGTAGAAAEFTYQTVNSFCCHTGDWTFETPVTTDGDVRRNWTWAGYHGTCGAVATLTPYIRHLGVTTLGAPLYNQADNCASNLLPAAGHGDGGQVVFAGLVAGDAYGFKIHASNGDLNGGVGGRLTVTTGTSPTTTALGSSANPIVLPSPITFTATVAGSSPTGHVTFTQEGREIQGCIAMPVVGNTATCIVGPSWFSAPPEPRSIIALYSGDSVNARSASPPFLQFTGAAPVLATPVLIRTLPAGSAVVPLLIGRVDGSPNTPITVRLFRGTTCTNGVLGGTTQVGLDAPVTTDPANPLTGYPGGYFGTLQGAAQGQFVAIQVTSPQVTPLSNCVVSAADNDTWPKALRLNGDSVTVPDWIDSAGKARWYRFSVLPGQSVQVTTSGAPADYDLAVFKDIAIEFDNELVPVNTTQLTKLSAQYAPSAFSPSAFSPSAFSPSAFSPSAFSPSAFSPSAFSPSAFSPSAFSPSAFSPSAFSPSAFSPSAFSPSAFSPSAFSPSAFSPSAFSPSAFSSDELEQAFSSAQTRSIIAASMTPGTGNESVVVNTWNNTGDFYVRVTGRAGAFSTAPYNLAVTKQGTSCSAVNDTAISIARTASGGGYNTIVLLDSTRTSLSEALPGGGTLGSKLASFVARTDVKGVIVDVALDGRVGTLKTQAGNNVGCPFAKNLVAFEIKSIIDAYLVTNPLRYIVLLGNDDAIPFFRYPDQTLLGQESAYVPPVSSNSASEASLRGNFVLTQDAYAAATHISLGVSEFPIPGGAVGRLIETPAEIAGMIDAYVAANGSISPSSSLVTGYDFLQDAADAVRTQLELGTGHTPDTLITPSNVSPADPRTYVNGGPWTANDLRLKLQNSRHDVMFLAGHFNANTALAADFKTSLVTSDILASSYLTNALVFSAGCHAGYNIVDTDVINGVTFPLDWAQAFAQKKVTLVAGTGYQYGDTEFLEYSERLYLNFAKELRAGTAGTPIAVGEALVKAKRAYLAATPDVRGLHAKAVLEATLFGLPMLGVNMPTGRTGVPTNTGVINAVAPVVPSLAATALGLRIAGDYTVSPTLTPHTLNLTNYDLPLPNTTTASWLSGQNGVVTNPAEPALPLEVVNVTPINPALVLRGVGFRGATYSDSTVLPLTGAPTTELRGVHTPFSSPVFFPMRLWTTNYFSALSVVGGGTNLLVTPAQHRALDASNSTLRQYSGLVLRLFYSDLTAVANPLNAPAFLSDAPTVVRVDAVPGGTVSTFSAQVVGDPAAAVHEVWVTYTNGAGGSGTWTSVNLQQCVAPLPAVCGATADSQYWKGEVATATLPADTKYVVQAASGTGLVSLDDNLGRYYSIAASAPAATALSFGATVPTSAVFGASVPVTVVLSAGASPLAGKVVTIAAGGGARSGTTNAAGSVTVQLPMLATPGSYALSASFGGDSGFLPSAVSASSAITVTKAVATLTLPTSGVGAVLKVGTQPLIQESIKFLVSGPQGVQQVFAITDYNGRATIPPPGLPSGTYSVIQACFAGSASYSNARLNANPDCDFSFAGFFQPVDSLPTINSVKAGSAIPVKFGLGGNYGLTIFDAGSPKSQTIACDTAAAVSDVEETVTAGGSSVSYDSGSGRYNYVWKTDKAWAGTCRQLILNFNDGSIQRANFKFK